MKKRAILLTLSSLSLLAACGEQADSVSSSDSETSLSSSAYAESNMHINFLQKLSNHDVTMTVYISNKPFLVLRDIQNKALTFYYPNNGDEDVVTFGVIQNENQGLFDFTLSDGAVVLGDMQSPVLGQSPDDYFAGWNYSPIDIAEVGSSVWTQTDELTFESTKSDITKKLAYLIGFSSDEAKKATKAVMTGDAEDPTKVTIRLTVNNSVYRLVFSDFGTSSFAPVDAYLKNPTDKANPTAFTEEEKTIIQKAVGDTPVPFFSEFTYGMIVMDYMASLEEVIIEDYVIGANDANCALNYGDLLVEAGWTLDPTNSDYLADGKRYDSLWLLYPTGVRGTNYTAQVDYMPCEKTDKPSAYPNGQFLLYLGYFAQTATYSGYTKVNGALGKYTYGESTYPTLTYLESVTDVKLWDETDGHEGYDHYFYLDIASKSTDSLVTVANNFGDAWLALGLTETKGAAAMDFAGQDYDASLSDGSGMSLTFTMEDAVQYDGAYHLEIGVFQKA